MAAFSNNTLNMYVETLVDTGDTVFYELLVDMVITKKILDAVDHLKKEKYHDLNYMYILNKYSK